MGRMPELTAPYLATPVSHPSEGDVPWWRTAVVYQIYPRSFADSDGDGVGDLAGVTSRLHHIARLGVDALRLAPFYRSPLVDGGYDVIDHTDVDPLFGSLADLDALVERAHQLGLRVIVDLVPNHTSDAHPWFRAALAAGPGSPERARYHFRDGRGDGSSPPNDWVSAFGGPAWTRITEPDGTPGQWYLHLFGPHQCDLDWGDARVGEAFEGILRFWLERGVDGFHISSAHGLVKQEGLPDFERLAPFVADREDPATPVQEERDEALTSACDGEASDGVVPGEASDGVVKDRAAPMWDQPGVHAIYREWRRLVGEYGPERILVGEAWVRPASALARYVRPDELHHVLDIGFLTAHWLPRELRRVIEEALRATDAVGAPASWVLSNDDLVRHPSRLGLPSAGGHVLGIGPDDVQPDAELGLRRGRAATLLMLALPGAAYLYQGEELGLPEVTSLDAGLRHDPIAGAGVLGREGCRVPIPWARDEPAFGFSPTGAAWLPPPPEWASLALDAQRYEADSTYQLYRRALRLRRDYGLGSGGLAWLDTAAPHVLGLVNGEVVVLTNVGEEEVALTEDLEVLVASGGLEVRDGLLWLPGDTTVWARRTEPRRRTPFGPD